MPQPPTAVIRMLVILAACCISVSASDQARAEAQFRKVTAMATDATGRRVVSMTVADTLQIDRRDLAYERRAMNLNYGDLFLLHMLLQQEGARGDIPGLLKSGRTMIQIATTLGVDWKRLTDKARTLNATIEDNLYRHFLDEKKLAARDKADGYSPFLDGVPADAIVPSRDIAEAERVYKFWRGRAGQREDSKLDAASRQAAEAQRGDPVRSRAGNPAPPPPPSNPPSPKQ